MADYNFNKKDGRAMDFYSLGNMGENTHPMQANQLLDLSQRLSTGQGKPMIITLKRDVWEVIPKQHFQEMYALSKLTGTEPTLHAPIIDPVGLTEQEGLSETHRQAEINLAKDVIYKAHVMSGDRNIPVTFHSDVLGMGTRWKKGLKDPETGELVEKELAWGIDVKSGKPVPLKFDIQYGPPTPKDLAEGKTESVACFTPEKHIRTQNMSAFREEVSQLHDFQWRIDKLGRRMNELPADSPQKEQMKRFANLLNDKIIMHVDTLYDHFKDEDMKPNFERFGEKGKKHEKAFYEVMEKAKKDNEEINKRILNIEERYMSAKTNEEKKLLESLEISEMGKRGKLWTGTFEDLERAGICPERIKLIEEVTMEKSADTFGELGRYSLMKVAKGNVDAAPIVAIENPPAMQFGFSRAEDLKQLIDASREAMAKKLVEKDGYSAEAAKSAANKLIGATWDVGHINFLKQGGYTDEDLVEETKKIAKDIKFIHLTDNFGSTDAHLPPGMGNIPIKDMMAEVEREGIRVPIAIEAGNFIQHHKESVWPATLEGLNSPIYEFSAQPSWGEQIGSYFFKSSYGTGYGDILPSYHFQTYGAGFSGLPLALGAPPAGAEKSKFSETPMA